MRRYAEQSVRDQWAANAPRLSAIGMVVEPSPDDHPEAFSALVDARLDLLRDISRPDSFDAVVRLVAEALRYYTVAELTELLTSSTDLEELWTDEGWDGEPPDGGEVDVLAAIAGRVSGVAVPKLGRFRVEACWLVVDTSKSPGEQLFGNDVYATHAAAVAVAADAETEASADA